MRKSGTHPSVWCVLLLFSGIGVPWRMIGLPAVADTEQSNTGVTGEWRTFFRAGESAEGATGVNFYESELHLHLDFSPRFSFTGVGEVENEGGALLGSFQESHFSVKDGTHEYRAGRFRVPFGIINREEVEYSGFIDIPLMKDESVRGFRLARVDTGLMAMGGSPTLRYEAAVINGTDSSQFVDNNSSKDVCVRLQTFHGRWITGVNWYSGSVEDGTSIPPADRDVHEYGLDWRYTIPNLIVRGELGLGDIGGQRTLGWHTDLLYHTPSVENLTLLVRYDRFDPNRGMDDDTEKRLTIGARYFFRPGITAALNVSWEHNIEIPANQRVEMQVSKSIIF